MIFYSKIVILIKASLNIFENENKIFNITLLPEAN